MAVDFYLEEGGWVKVQEILGSEEKPLALFLDFDGTVAPLRPTPEMAALPIEYRTLLADLCSRPGIFFSIVTGRCMEDIKRKVAIPGVCYIASHGLEMECLEERWVHPEALARKEGLDEMARYLGRSMKEFPGVLVERKPYTLSVHYRQMKDPAGADRLRECVTSYMRESANGFRVSGGKKVIEIKPDIEWDKGKAVVSVLEKMGRHDSLTVYIGDDLTDEDAFRALRSGGITIKVGRQKTAAEFFVEGTNEVLRFLEDVRLFF